jgi:hypothetical protein
MDMLYTIKQLTQQLMSFSQDREVMAQSLGTKLPLSFGLFNWDQTLQEFQLWFDTIIRSSPPPSNLQAIKIGLCIINDEYHVYISGYTHYDPYESGWECNDDWLPDNRFIQISNFSGMKNLLKSIKRSNHEPWFIIQLMIIIFVKQYFRQNCAQFSQKIGINRLHVFVGFDDGDLLPIATEIKLHDILQT